MEDEAVILEAGMLDLSQSPNTGPHRRTGVVVRLRATHHVALILSPRRRDLSGGHGLPARRRERRGRRLSPGWPVCLASSDCRARSRSKRIRALGPEPSRIAPSSVGVRVHVVERDAETFRQLT